MRNNQSPANINGSSQPQQLLWHYTYSIFYRRTFERIIESGVLGCTDIRIALGERPVAWFSANQHWEETVQKTQSNGRTSMTGMLAEGFSLYRIGVKPVVAPYSWRGEDDLISAAHIPPQVARKLERTGREWGAKPLEWHGSLEPVPQNKWEEIEHFDGKQWRPWRSNSQPTWTPFKRYWETESRDAEVYANSRYYVQVSRFTKPGAADLLYLSIRNHERTAVHDWRDFQRIKNELLGTEQEAIEIYPAESRLVDTANQYHLWCVADAKVPFGYLDRDVSEGSFVGEVQRPFEDDARPSDLKREWDREMYARMEIGGRKLTAPSLRGAPPRLLGRKVGRNEACPCGSGVKYKRCCLEVSA